MAKVLLSSMNNFKIYSGIRDLTPTHTFLGLQREETLEIHFLASHEIGMENSDGMSGL